MIATIRRTYTFEAAHFLPFVCEGHKCGRMHGHSYRVTAHVRGSVGDDGMVCDFAVIDDVFRPLVARLDHSTLNDTIANPTSELLAAWLIAQARDALPMLHGIEVSETERSSAWIAVDDLCPEHAHA